MSLEDVFANSNGVANRHSQIQIEVIAADHSLEVSKELLMGVMNATPHLRADPARDLKLGAVTRRV